MRVVKLGELKQYFTIVHYFTAFVGIVDRVRKTKSKSMSNVTLLTHELNFSIHFHES